ncbi:hypothetical protein MMC18_001337 [Xylographa bjoerkii]|nr:hypothetical protein [Xylographa bjoerkii]
MPLPNLNSFRDDLRLTTWLLVGACLQSLLVLSLPRYVALLPAALVLGTRFLVTLLMTQGLIHNPGSYGVHQGRMTAITPLNNGSVSRNTSDHEIVLFIVTSRSSHALGRFAPGYIAAGDYFQAMLEEAGRNHEKWGYLGKTSCLIATDDDASNTLVWLTYWKDVDHLHAFARGDFHQAGWDWYNSITKKYPYIGVGHEMYSVPEGHWENIYCNLRPFGMGQTRYFDYSKELLAGQDEDSRFVSPLITAKGATWKSMISRMGRFESL